MSKQENNLVKKFEVVWSKIIKHQGEKFLTIRGFSFTYTVTGNYFHPSQTSFNIHKNNFMDAYRSLPIDKSNQANSAIMAPSYVWGALNDARIM